MASIVGVCNRALSKLGASRITSLGDNSTAAKACDASYESVRDAVLRSHVWNCTVTRTSLAPLSTKPAFDFDYEYQLPGDCIKIIEIDSPMPWTVEGRKVLTNEGSVLYVRYQKLEENPNQYDTLLLETIAAKLAYEMCEEITQSNSKKESAFRDYKDLMDQAQLRDSQEQSPAELYEDDWINARF